MKKFFYLTSLAGLLTGISQAALVADWADPNVITVTDLIGDSSSPGAATDILSIRFVAQNNINFFLMTIGEAPSIATYAEGYLLNFDYQSGGANASSSYYVASGLVGIDKMIDVHNFQGTIVSYHVHEYIGGDTPQFNTLLHSDFGIGFNTDATGTQLEWSVPVGVLPDLQTMTVFGSTLLASPNNKATYDTTDGLTFTSVPEPGGVLLLTLGMTALGLRRRRA